MSTGPDRRPATDAEARALASSLRLRILRMCLDAPQTNAQLAQRLDRPPGSVLHHVRTLVTTGFLQALPTEQGPRGSRPTPYRATRKSWTLSTPGSDRAMIQSFLDTVAGVVPGEVDTSRLGLRLDDEGLAELQSRLRDLLEEFAAREPTPAGRPWSLFVALHPDPDRD